MKRYKLQFELNGTPLRLNSTLRMHFHKRNAYYRDWYTAVAHAVARQTPTNALQRARLSFIRFAPRTLDFDGLVGSLKPIADGLIHAGVIHDDNWKAVGPWQVDQAFTKTGTERIRVIVESLESEGADAH